jgi:vacuolar-type H+-ATPase subunit H
VFRALETWVEAQRGAAKGRAEAGLAEARAEAERLRQAGEERLRQVVVEAEREAVRTAEDAARDRVSAARVVVHRWIDAAERDLEPVVEEALTRLTGG